MSAQTPHAPTSIFSLRRRPVACYFGLTFFLSWLGAFFVAAPHLLRGQPLPNLTGILMFPAMLVGPSLSSILLTRLFDGPAGLLDLFSRMRRFDFPARWYAALLIPPVFVLSVLLFLKTFVSPVYSPNRFWLGLAFGIPAGLFEEIGWTGFAFPRMSLKLPPLRAAILLGLLWGLWHIPVINFLGTAVPHGAYWLHFFIAFTAAMTAMRVLISWLYAHTESIPLAQLMHACSTGSLVVFSPPAATAAKKPSGTPPTPPLFGSWLSLWLFGSQTSRRSPAGLQSKIRNPASLFPSVQLPCLNPPSSAKLFAPQHHDSSRESHTP